MTTESRAIFVISDLHMGDGGPRDNFAVGKRETQLSSFLDYVQQENGRLIILGDLFEFWQASLGKVLMNRRSWLDRFTGIGGRYVVGNHDADLGGLIGSDMLSHPFFRNMGRAFTEDIGAKRFRFMHGHEVDPFNCGDSPSWGRMLAIFAGIFEDRNGSPMLSEGVTVEEALTKFGEVMLRLWNWLAKRITPKVGDRKSASPKNELTPSQNPDLAKKMLKEYEKERTKGGYDVLISGHTHQAGRAGEWYLNSGCWAGATNNFVRISADGQGKVFDWRNGGPVANETVLSV
ncbi:MAG TPA: UDP-2,3-diacylglucosamine diphosphatase [Sedimentisphaerales bacterium]|nr:UDP-2,3-diacylglucosamine diphosphatase [Sedimentisphaerales bacterium]